MSTHSPMAPPNPRARPPDDNLEMIADMFTAMKATGKDPDMPITEIADIGQQLIDMIRDRDRQIADLKTITSNMMANVAQQQNVKWNPEVTEWRSGPYSREGK